MLYLVLLKNQFIEPVLCSHLIHSFPLPRLRLIIILFILGHTCQLLVDIHLFSTVVVPLLQKTNRNKQRQG